MNNNITVEELKTLLEKGDKAASDLLWELAKADARKAWDYIGIEDIEQQLNDSDIRLRPDEVLDYIKTDYMLINVDDEVAYIIDYLWNRKLVNEY